MAAFGYDDLFNDACLAEKFNHSRHGSKKKFTNNSTPKINKFRNGGETEAFDINEIRSSNRFTAAPKKSFHPHNERYMTHFDQFSTMEDNDTQMSTMWQHRSFVPSNNALMSNGFVTDQDEGAPVQGNSITGSMTSNNNLGSLQPNLRYTKLNILKTAPKNVKIILKNPKFIRKGFVSNWNSSSAS